MRLVERDSAALIGRPNGGCFTQRAQLASGDVITGTSAIFRLFASQKFVGERCLSVGVGDFGFASSIQWTTEIVLFRPVSKVYCYAFGRCVASAMPQALTCTGTLCLMHPV